MYYDDTQGNPASLWNARSTNHNNIDICLYSNWKNIIANNMERSSSAQRKVRNGSKCVKNFLSKRQKVIFVNVRDRSGGCKRGGGGRIRIKFTLFSPFPRRLIITDSVINSDFKIIQHRHKENEFWPSTINVLMIIPTEVLKFPNYNFTHYQLKFLTNTHYQNKTFSLLLSINCLVKWLVTVS